jgi:hypothetical protein
MTTKYEIKTIEFMLRKIFKQNKISKYDVAYSNKLLHRWKVLTKHKENTEYPLLEHI